MKNKTNKPEQSQTNRQTSERGKEKASEARLEAEVDVYTEVPLKPKYTEKFPKVKKML